VKPGQDVRHKITVEAAVSAAHKPNMQAWGHARPGRWFRRLDETDFNLRNFPKGGRPFDYASGQAFRPRPRRACSQDLRRPDPGGLSETRARGCLPLTE
jgi:hypothetical protein